MSQFNTEYIPTSNEDLFMWYFWPENGLVKQTIRAKANGSLPSDTVEELSSAIMFRFIESDLLLRFDPKRVSSFQSFLYNIVVNAVNDEYRRQKRNGGSVEVVESVSYSDESEETRDNRHVAAIEASQQVSMEFAEQIECMRQFAARCSRMNRHKRDRSLRAVLAMTADGDCLESISGAIGTSVATVRNYIRYIAHGALAEVNGTAAAYAAESTYRPDARREMSAKDLAGLVRANPDKQVAVADSDGSLMFPQFVAARRGWHFVTLGTDGKANLSPLTAATRGFKFHRPNGEVVNVRHFDTTNVYLILAESVPEDDRGTDN